MAFFLAQIACCAFSHHKLAAGEGGGGGGGVGGAEYATDSSSACYQIQLPKAGNACAIKLGLTASCASVCSVSPSPPPWQGVKQEVVDKKKVQQGQGLPLTDKQDNNESN